MANELQKSIDALREIEAEQLALQKKQAEETAEDRKTRVDKKAFDAQVKAFDKIVDLEDKALFLTEKSFKRLEKGVLAASLKANKKSGEVQSAILNLTKDSSLQAFAKSVEGKKVKREEASIGLRISNIKATLQSKLLKETEIGKAILVTTLKKGGSLSKVVENILDQSLANNTELKKEIFKLRENIVGKFKDVTKTLGNFKKKLLRVIEIAFNPLELLKFFGKLTFQKVITPLGLLLGKTLLKGITLPLKGIDNLIGKFFTRFILGPKKVKPGTGLLGLASAEKRREAERKENRMSKILGQLALALTGFRGIFSKKGAIAALSSSVGSVRKLLTTLGTGAAGGLAAFGATKLARFGIGAAKFGAKRLLPLATIVLAVRAGFVEFTKTGDIQKAIAEGLVGAAEVLSFGLINTEELREKLKKPFLGIVEGITGFLDGELSPKNFRSLAEGSLKLGTAPFDIAFKMGTQITESVARLFGAKKFADDLDAAMKNFNIGQSIVSAIDNTVKAIADFVAGPTVEAFTAGIKLRGIEAINKASSIQGLKQALKGFAQAQTELNNKIVGGKLRGEAFTRTQTQLQAIDQRFKAAAKRLVELEAENATLQEKASRAAPVVIPSPAVPVVVPNTSSPGTIIAPPMLRNNENTFRRIISKDFTGTQG